MANINAVVFAAPSGVDNVVSLAVSSSNSSINCYGAISTHVNAQLALTTWIGDAFFSFFKKDVVSDNMISDRFNFSKCDCWFVGKTYQPFQLHLLTMRRRIVLKS